MCWSRHAILLLKDIGVKIQVEHAAVKVFLVHSNILHQILTLFKFYFRVSSVNIRAHNFVWVRLFPNDTGGSPMGS